MLRHRNASQPNDVAMSHSLCSHTTVTDARDTRVEAEILAQCKAWGLRISKARHALCATKAWCQDVLQRGEKE